MAQRLVPWPYLPFEMIEQCDCCMHVYMCACQHCAYSYACVLFLFEPLFLCLQKGNGNISSILLRPVVWFSDTTYLKVLRKSLALMNYLYPNHFLVPKGICGRYVSGEASVPGLSMNFLPLKILKVHISQLMPQWIMSFLGASSFLKSVRRRCPIVSWVPISRVPTMCYFLQRLEICISFFFPGLVINQAKGQFY